MLCLLLPELQVIIISKSIVRFLIQLLYLRPISSLLSLILFYIMLLLEPSPVILFLVILAISKLLSHRKLQYYEKHYQKVLFYNKQTEIVNLTTL
jgi:hypothetical protein